MEEDIFSIGGRMIKFGAAGIAVGVGVASRWLPTLAAIPVGGFIGGFLGTVVGFVASDKPVRH